MDNLKIEEGFNCKQEGQLQMLLYISIYIYTSLKAVFLFLFLWIPTVKRSNNVPTVPYSTHHLHGVIRELDGYGFSDVLHKSVHLVFLGDAGRSLEELGHLLVTRVLSQYDDVATRLVG